MLKTATRSQKRLVSAPPRILLDESRARLRRALEIIVEDHVLALHKLRGGKTHTVYKIVTPARRLVIKIFRERVYSDPKEAPEYNKLLFVHSELEQRGIPGARLIAFEDSHELFPAGYALFEFVAGRRVPALIAHGTMTAGEYMGNIAAYLKEVHRIKLSSYGSISPIKERYASYATWKTENVLEGTERLKERLPFGRKESQQVQMAMRPLQSAEKYLSPVLVHNDPWPTNSILTGRGVVLLDWDEAYASIWPTDLASLTYTNNTDTEGTDRTADIFIERYGESNLPPDLLEETIRALHLVQAMDLLRYHHYQTNDRRQFELVKRKFISLLG